MAWHWHGGWMGDDGILDRGASDVSSPQADRSFKRYDRSFELPGDGACWRPVALRWCPDGAPLLGRCVAAWRRWRKPRGCVCFVPHSW